MINFYKNLKLTIFLFAAAAVFMWVTAGCDSGPKSYTIPDFYSPLFTQQSVSSDGKLVNVTVKDNSSQNISVDIYVRKYGEKTFNKPVRMAAAGNNSYTYGVPADYTSFEYYFAASDGTNFCYYPAGAPTSYFSKLIGVPQMVYDYYKVYAPLKVSNTTQEVLFAIKAFSPSLYPLTKVEVQYRKIGTTDFTYLSMDETNGVSLPTDGGVNFTKPETGEVKIYYKNAGILAEGDYEYRIKIENALYKDLYNPKDSLNAFTISATVTDTTPLAVITLDKSKYFLGELNIKLDGGKSISRTGGQLDYIWTHLNSNEVEAIKLETMNQYAYFTPSKLGRFIFSLQVRDKNNNSLSDVVKASIDVVESRIPTEDGGICPATVENGLVVTLKKVSSPFIVTQQITIQNGGQLKIERGVEIKFNSGAKIVVQNNGRINADGDADNKILMISSFPFQDKGQWGGIEVIDDKTYPYSSFNFCTIKSAITGIKVVNSYNPTISNCDIQMCSNEAILSDNSTVTITENTISNNETGITCQNFSVSTISNNSVSKNKAYGIKCDKSKSEIAGNTATENNYGIYVKDSKQNETNIVNVTSNKVSKNTDGLRIENSDPVVNSNEVMDNNDNGIICYKSMPIISLNAVHDNSDSGIQMNDCEYRTLKPLASGSGNIDFVGHEIYNNVVSNSGGDGIELYASNPIINHNIIAGNYNAGIYIKSYPKLDNNSQAEQRGILIINNHIAQNSRAGISRNGYPPDYNANGYFSTMLIMINNNNFYYNSQVYTDVEKGENYTYGNTNEIYLNSAFSDFAAATNSVIFSGASYDTDGISIANQNGTVLKKVTIGTLAIHMLRDANAPARWNDGRNISVEPKLNGQLSSPAASTWNLQDIGTHPRNGGGRYNTIDGTLADVSKLINSGTSYPWYSGSLNNDIGVIWDAIIKR